MGHQVRAAFRSRAALPPSTSNPMLAPRRDGRHHRGQAALAVGSTCWYKPGATPPLPCACCASCFASRASRPTPSPIGFVHTAQAFASSGSPPARTRPAEKQSRRELASARETTRAQDATVQIARISATLLVLPRCSPQRFGPPATSDLAPDSPPVPGRSDEHVAGCDRCLSCLPSKMATLCSNHR